jgi:two-component system nitrogen regulation response regulator GlnG
MSRIMVVDDEESICWSVEQLLREEGHDVQVASSAESALAAAELTRPDVVLLDVRLPGIDGLSAMRRFQHVAGPVPIVVMTAFGDLETAVTAVRNGAFEYLAKPFDASSVVATIARALEQRLAARSEQSDFPSAPREELLGTSAAMQEVFKRIALVAPSEASVLVTGESGAGKELVARAIHRHSRRAGGPLIPVNVASLSTTLIESELFGHARGAFTGAEAPRKGLVELADGGTLFLDEVADIPLEVQVKLLRVLEQREVIPVGDTHARPVDFRVVAATHRDLRQEAQGGRFRTDLYFRLAVFDIEMPPLRERPDDIPELAGEFLRRLCPLSGGAWLTEPTIRELARRPWPGNVRELRNAVEHAALLAREGPIAPEHLPPATVVADKNPTAPRSALEEAVDDWARDQLSRGQRLADLHQGLLDVVEPPLFKAVLEKTGQNHLEAAEILGIHRATLRKKLR